MSTSTPEGEARSIAASKQEGKPGETDIESPVQFTRPDGQMTIPDDTNLDRLAEKLDELLARQETQSSLADIPSSSTSVSGQPLLSPLPSWALSPAALAARRRERDRILDILEREEEEEFAREAGAAVTYEPTDRNSTVSHSVPTTPPRTLDQVVRSSTPISRPTASLPISSSYEGSSQPSGDSAAQPSREPLTTRKPKKQKSVSFVDPPSNDHDDRPRAPKPELDWGDVIPVQLGSRKPGPAKGHGVMKDLVIERPTGQSASIVHRVVDSDDEDEHEELNGIHDVPEDEDSETEVPKEAFGQLTTSDDEPDTDPEDPAQSIDIDDTDFDEAMLQREIALAYYARRNQIGTDIASGPLFNSSAMDRTVNHDEGKEQSDGGVMRPILPDSFGRLVDGELVAEAIADKEVEASVNTLTGGDDADQEDMTEKMIELLRQGDTYVGDDHATTEPKRSIKHAPGKMPATVLTDADHPCHTSLPGRAIPPPPTVDQPMIIESGSG
ncbi:hypothetical protein RHS01_06249 [Rhizoctonia solani]|uniref:DUF3835 domain-containing protein n=1 Tax=Rhizoctonia solani TaxID=456999 RepID=A0A8H7M3S5_9AGAM|nr:hypothetical protein RHS01_06249 [Rhizoctonia solani]